MLCNSIRGRRNFYVVWLSKFDDFGFLGELRLETRTLFIQLHQLNQQCVIRIGYYSIYSKIYI